jgi:hypothetical protein
MIVGCYSMDLYCDAVGCVAGGFNRYPAKAEFTACLSG